MDLGRAEWRRIVVWYRRWPWGDARTPVVAAGRRGARCHRVRAAVRNNAAQGCEFNPSTLHIDGDIEINGLRAAGCRQMPVAEETLVGALDGQTAATVQHEDLDRHAVLGDLLQLLQDHHDAAVTGEAADAAADCCVRPPRRTKRQWLPGGRTRRGAAGVREEAQSMFRRGSLKRNDGRACVAIDDATGPSPQGDLLGRKSVHHPCLPTTAFSARV